MEGKKRGRYLFKNTIIFAIGNFGTKLISFFLVPLYTNVLLTNEYGVVDLVTTIGTVAIPVLTLNIGEAIMRFALDKDADHDKIMSTGFVILFFSALLSPLLIPITSFFSTLSNYAVYVYLYTVTLAFSQVFLCYLRGKEYLLKYSIGNIIHSLAIAVTNIVFLLVFKMGIEGFLMAYVVSNVITAVYAFFAGKVYKTIRRFNFDSSLTKKMAKYSIVLIPNSFMWWIMNSSDRIMVTAMVSVAANGIYAIAYKIPTLLSTITTIFNQAWSYSAIKEKDSKDKNEYNNAVYNRLVQISITVACGLLMIMKIFLRYYVGAEYYISWIYTPFLMVGFVFMTIGTFIATSTYTVHKDSKGFLFSGMAGALVNIALNFALIPLLQTTGAAIATCISYIVVYIYRVIDTKKYIKLNVLKKDHLVGYLFLIIMAGTMFIDNNVGQILLIIEFLCVFFIYRSFWFAIIKGIAGKFKKKKKKTTSSS